MICGRRNQDGLSVQRWITRIGDYGGDNNLTALEIPMVATARLRLRAFRTSDLDADAAMHANPEYPR